MPSLPTPERGDAGNPARRVLVWRLAEPLLSIASAPHGGGIGPRAWVVNAQVPSDYARVDVDEHLGEIATELGCAGAGVGFLTAASVDAVAETHDRGVSVFATVGLRHPTWAAAPDGADAAAPIGTINIVASVPTRLADAALVNAVMTVTEAKTQALLDAGIAGTGTASDAVCVLTPLDGRPEPFAGPRSDIGAALARAVYGAVTAGSARA